MDLRKKNWLTLENIGIETVAETRFFGLNKPKLKPNFQSVSGFQTCYDDVKKRKLNQRDFGELINNVLSFHLESIEVLVYSNLQLWH